MSNKSQNVTMSLVLILISPAVLVTATLSGIFGMGGGMVLMGIYAGLLPVASAMVLHGVTQLAANGSRALFLRRHVNWTPCVWFSAGTAIAVVVMVAVSVTVSETMLFMVLGGTPLVLSRVPREWAPRIDSRAGALLCGALVTSCQLVAGSSGPLLDAFFARSNLTRYQVIGTKALLQTGGHAVKLIYFVLLVPPAATRLPPWIYPTVVLMALLGTRLGKVVLDAMSDTQFRESSGRLIAVIATVFLIRGVVGVF